MESIFLITAVMGAIELIKALNGHDWQTSEIIAIATIIGALCGFFAVDNLTIVTGMQAGLSAAGIYKGAKLMGGLK